jgi:hypothetical protein
MLKKLLYALLILLALLLLIGAFLPTRYAASQSVEIRSDRARVHEFVGELRRWDEWGPWKDEDPSLVVTHSSLTTGVGAHQSWTGDSGSGELTFTQCSPEQGIAYDLSCSSTGSARRPYAAGSAMHPLNRARASLGGLRATSACRSSAAGSCS